ncbi:hypothetical protein DP68_07855 [Clostridium sp. HMP27]|nr:hypothetical protein DP68_07855 [Clostridium sp. HMP27]
MNAKLHGNSCFVCSEPIIVNPCESCKNVELHIKMPPYPKPIKPCKFNYKALVILIFILLLYRCCCYPTNCNNRYY